MSQTTGRVSRRQFSKLFGGSVLAMPWAFAQTSAAQEVQPKAESMESRWTESQKREAQKALEAMEKESQTIGKFEIPIAAEPAFIFRAVPIHPRRASMSAAEDR